ncbi:hypothetical protein NHJ13734_006371 [Beauveria thailandica]
MVQPSLGAIVSSALLGSIGGFDSASPPNAASQAPVVNLTGIGQYQGFRLLQSISGSRLPHSVDAWLGIDYALQPAGDRRFKPVEQPPERFDGIRAATSFGPICTQDKTYEYRDEQSESCLNFNVYRPTGVPMTQKLPTLVWIHGGAFSLYSGRTMDGGSFVASSEQPVMVITFNYRLNSLGFLPSSLFERLGLLNLGLRDQHFFLQFLQTHLHSFGGDPDQVTLGGLSAGSHSAAFEYFHNYGQDEGAPLFARVLLQSGAITARAFPDITYPRYESDFKRLMHHVGCNLDDGDEAQIRCLRDAPIDEIEQVSSKIYAEAESNLNWPWQPVVGGPRLERPGSQGYRDGTFHQVPIITTHTTDEGKYYTPGHLETNDDFIRFWQNLCPYLNVTDLAILNELYPDPVAHPDSTWAQSPNSTQYNRVSGSWSDMAYICPSRETASTTSNKGVATWRLRFNTPGHPLEAHGWRGIPHASDAAYIWNEPTVPFPEVARTYHAYMASFVAAGDPNKFRLEGSPEWPQYKASDRLNGRCPQQLAVHPVQQPKMAKKIPASEVRKHSSSDSCWIVVDGHVYDMTSFAPTHPGGAQIIYRYAGKDATDQYNAVHAPSLISKTLDSDDHVGRLDETWAPTDWKPSRCQSPAKLAGRRYPLSSIISLHDFEASAKSSFSQKSWAYVNSASNDCITRDANIEMLKRIWFRPAVMRNVGTVNTGTSLFGCSLDIPVYISAVGAVRAAGPEGELAFARGAASSGIVHCISTSASYPLQEILDATPKHAWFQLYVNKDRQKTEQLLQLLQKSGKIKALFVTVDLAIVSKREEDERAGQGPIDGLGAPDSKGAGLARQSGAFIDPELSWEDIPWIRKFSNLPIIVKGIQRWEDAQMAIQHGCSGIVVSNHGGRAADTAQPAIITLLELHKNLPKAFDQLSVLIDGGFRRGSDVVKAICLGASAVGLGRSFMYSVNYGEAGVVHATRLLREEIEMAMRLCGMTTLMADASPRFLNTKLVDGYVADREHEYLREPRRIRSNM